MCGSAGDWSEEYTLRSLGVSGWSPRFAVYGDMGTENAVSLPWLVEEATTGDIDAVLHLGDFAYNLFNVSSPLIIQSACAATMNTTSFIL